MAWISAAGFFTTRSAFWIELNAIVISRIMQRGDSVESIVTDVAGQQSASDAIEFLRLADEMIRKILYIEDFAEQKLFFPSCTYSATAACLLGLHLLQ